MRGHSLKPFIYGLVDPLTPGHVRYVGMAMRADRPKYHEKEARNPRAKLSYKINWIRSLQAEAREPLVLVLEELSEGAPREFVGEIEKMYISSLRRIGHRLTNITPGGDGFHGRHTPETLTLMSIAHLGNCMSEEAREKSSAKQRGRANRGCGKPHTSAHKAWVKARQEKLYEDVANREVQRVAQEKAWADPIKRSAHSEIMKAAWAKRKADASSRSSDGIARVEDSDSARVPPSSCSEQEV